MLASRTAAIVDGNFRYSNAYDWEPLERISPHAAMAAIALKACRLVFMSDVPGLMRDPKDPATVISHLSVSEVPELKATGVVDKGMIPKVDSAVSALKSGVDKVSFVDGRVPHSVLLEIFTDDGVGTEVVLQ